MAYAAIISLSNTIDRILNHNQISISLAENQQILSLLDHVTTLQAFLEKFPDTSNSLEGRMRELAYEAEDIIDYFMSEQVASWPHYQIEETILWLKQAISNIDGEEVQRHANSSTLSSSSTAPPIHKDSVVGFEDYVMDLKGRLCGGPFQLQVIPICGMAGIGKTILAKKVYDDPLVVDHFPVSGWVTIPQEYSVQMILSSLLQSLKEFDTCGLAQSDEEKVYQILRGRRYFVVLDSIWSSNAWDVIRKVFPDNCNGSCVLLTTRLSCIMASYPDHSSKPYQMGLLSEDQSWNLLKRKLYADEDCPSELENIGKEITRCCKGWPLALVAIARILSTTTRNLASWQKIREDILKYLDLEKVLSSSDTELGKQELQLKKVIKEIALIVGEVNGIKDISRSKGIRLDVDSSAALSSSSTAPPICRDSLVGFKDYILDLKDRLCGDSFKLQIIPICGMGGIGKTTLARNVYDDPLIMSHFDIRVWVTISQDYSARRILSSLVESLKDFDTGRLGKNDDEKIHKILIGRRYLVVMDDIWSTEAWDIVRKVFPDDGSGSRVLLTTRLSDVASYPDASSKLHEIGLLNTDQRWNLLEQKVFANEVCPYELESVGKEIARSCKGLPLAIVVIAGLLSTVNKNPTSWLKIAQNMKSAVFTEYDRVEEILSLSYVQLPQYLRPCFLYIASFPEDHEINVSRLIRLWVAEGVVKSPIDSDCFEKVGEECLEELVKRNLVMVRERKWDGRIKSCSLHDLMRDLCISKAYESKLFLNVMDTHLDKDRFMESIKNQRRVSVNYTYLSCLSSDDGSTIRSFRCSNYHLVKLEFVKSVRLLRVLDTELGFVEGRASVHQLCELSHLRYLAFRHTSSIPRGLTLLQNLQTLIIHGEKLRVGAVHDLWLSWCMHQLRYVYFYGTIYIDDPKETTDSFESLQTLSYVTHSTCTERILKKIPNLKKLKIDCSGGRHRENAAWLDDLVHLHRLENLEVYAGCLVYSRPKHYKITYPSMLKKLTLRDMRLAWSDMIVVGSLLNLRVLKLKGCTCVGGTWETNEGSFPMLEVLLVENASNFEDWITESSHFPRLKRVLLHSCEDLNGIPNDIGEIPTLELIEITGRVKKSLKESVEQIQQEQEELGNNTLQVLCIAKSSRLDEIQKWLKRSLKRSAQSMR